MRTAIGYSMQRGDQYCPGPGNSLTPVNIIEPIFDMLLAEVDQAQDAKDDSAGEGYGATCRPPSLYVFWRLSDHLYQRLAAKPPARVENRAQQAGQHTGCIDCYADLQIWLDYLL